MKFRYQWITDPDKNPQNYEDVLVTVTNDEISPPERNVVLAYYVNGTFYDSTFNTEITDVVAWTYQPYPYTEDLDDGE